MKIRTKGEYEMALKRHSRLRKRQRFGKFEGEELLIYAFLSADFNTVTPMQQY